MSFSTNPLFDPALIPTKATRISLLAKEGNVDVPIIATGTWSWGDSTWNYEAGKDLHNVKEAFKEALRSQGGFLDTAEVYGRGESERIIRQCLESLSPEQKKNVVVATKALPFPTPQNWFIWSPGTVNALRKSLARLGLDSVDLYQLHAPIGIHSFQAHARELAQCVKLGLCKAVGVSNFSKEELIKFSDLLSTHGVPLASNQIEFNLLRQGPLKNGLLEEMRKRDIVCLAYSPLAQGRLAGKYSSTNPPPSGRRFSNMPMEKIDPLVNSMRAIAEARDVPVSAVALNWVLAKGCIPLGGARNANQAQQNAKALDWRLSEEECERLEGLGFDGSTSFWQHG